jgi:hypothetical protein
LRKHGGLLESGDEGGIHRSSFVMSGLTAQLCHSKGLSQIDGL